MDNTTANDIAAQLKRIADALEGIDKELGCGEIGHLGELLYIREALQHIATEQHHRRSS